MQYLLIVLVISVFSSQPVRSELAHTTPVLLSHPQGSIASLSHGTSEDLQIGLEVFGDQLTLLLSPNKNLFHDNYVYQHLDDDDNVASQNGLVTPCHFSGTVECVACHNSHTSVSTCGGHLRGLISYNDTDYYIEPLIGSSEGTHFVYSSVSSDNETQSELLVDSSDWLSRVTDSHLRSARDFAVSNKRLFIETLVVLDETMVSHHGAQADTYALTIMNIVSGLLSRPSLGQSVTLVVTRLVSQTGTNTYTWNPSDPDSSLSDFCKWQHGVNGTDGSPTHDLGLLLTRRSLCPLNTLCGVIGVANVGGLCSGTHSCLIVRDQGVMLAGTTVTHEIGHVLGMYHDENPTECGAYNIPPSSYIMTQLFTAASNHFEWSECSKHSIVDFLSRGGDTCLLNQPTNQIQLSDAPLSADEQCRSSLSANARAVPSRSTCASLTCFEIVAGESHRTSFNTPMVDGTNCSINRDTQGECYSGVCVRKDRPDQPIDGQWSQWLDWSECSHSCDTGERHRERKCVSPAPAFGGAMCLGDRRQYATCFRSECDTSAPSRRTSECVGLMYQHPGTWTALSDNYRVSDPCRLYCQDTNGNIASLPSSVEDGIECHATTPERAMCVLGSCVAVDCRGELAGAARLDKCGLCGGDDTSCHVVKGTINEYLPSFSLHKLISIPQEARDLTILNKTPHPYVHLAITQSSSTRLFRPIRMQTINGVAWRCATFSNGSDTCSASGPIVDSLDLKVFGGPTQVALYYSYIMPPEETHVWRPESMCSTCNATCGDAVRNCVAECVDVSGIAVSSHLCDPAIKPLDTFHPCEGLPDCPKYIWAPSGWGPCSVTCGRGVKTRSTPCFIQTASSFQPADESNCVSGTRPITSLSCSTPCVRPTASAPIAARYPGGWMAEKWGKCENCVEHSELQIECRIDGQSVDQSECDPATKPTPQQKNCPQECVAWEARPWRSCDTNCRQTRTFRCVENGRKVRPNVCRDAKVSKPQKSKKCPNC